MPRDEDESLRAGLATDARKRLSRVQALWPEGRPGSAIAPAVLASGVFRTWLASVEDALETLRLAKAAGSAPPGSAAWSRLLDRVADLGALPDLAPGGSLPRDFPRRAKARATRDLARLARSLRSVAAADVRQPSPSAAGKLADRVPKALTLLASAWPDAARMVHSRTHTVVAIDDPGVVSYSSAREPGIAYVSVRSSPSVRLAEDLLHETTHMRIHEIESLAPLVLDAGREDGPRFYSPWRREWRPLRGLLHGACTFTVGARFFERMLASRIRFSRARRAWLARRFLEEMESTRVALRTLGRPGAKALLTPTGRELVRTVAKERASLLPAARERRRLLRKEAPRELRSFEEWRLALARRPFRSEAHRLASR